MNEPKILIVDSNDKPIGQAYKPEVWKTGAIHRIVWVLVEDAKGRILLQKRPETMELHPGKWDNSVGGHVDAGETYEQAALRESNEELGLTNIELVELGKFYEESLFDGKKLNRFYKTYKTVVEPMDVKPDLEEIADIKWLTLSEIKEMMKNQPDEILGRAITEYYI